MKRRIISIIIAAALCLTLLPGAALAAGELEIPTTGLVIDLDTASSVSYKAGSGTAEWDASAKTLTLTNATIAATEAVNASQGMNTGLYSNALEFTKASSEIANVRIILTGENTITGVDSASCRGILAKTCALTFTGSGSLTVTAGNATSSSMGIECYSLTVEEGANVAAGCMNTQSVPPDYSYGVSVTSAVSVDGTLKTQARSGSSGSYGIGGFGSSASITVGEKGYLETRGNTNYFNGYGIHLNGSYNIKTTVLGTLIAVAKIPYGGGYLLYQNRIILKIAKKEGDEASAIMNPQAKTYFVLEDNMQYACITPNLKLEQEKLSITGQPEVVRYGNRFQLSTSGGSGTGAITWKVMDEGKGVATISPTGFVQIKNMGGCAIWAIKAADDTYESCIAVFSFNVQKAIPDVGTVSLNRPILVTQDLSYLTFSYSNVSKIPGMVKLAEGTVLSVGTKEYTWVFTAFDNMEPFTSGLYETTATGKILLTVKETESPLVSIAITKQPTKTTYTDGDIFDPAGMVITAAYEDGTSAEVTAAVQYTGKLAEGQTELELSYTEKGANGSTQTCTLTGLTVTEKIDSGDPGGTGDTGDGNDPGGTGDTGDTGNTGKPNAPGDTGNSGDSNTPGNTGSSGTTNTGSTGSGSSDSSGSGSSGSGSSGSGSSGSSSSGSSSSGASDRGDSSSSKNPDGSTTTTKEDAKTGAVITTTRRPDGSTSTTVVTAEGRETTSVRLSAAAVSAAQESGVPAALPMVPVEAARSAADAPTITVTTGVGSAVRVEVPVERAAPGTVAVLVQPDGTEKILVSSLPTENGVSVPVISGAQIKVIDNGKTFADSVSHWAADPISFVTARELFSGVNESTFAPDATMTRAMLATVLARYAGVQAMGAAAYEAGLNWAKEKGVSDGSNPGSPVSREQLAVMLHRFAGSPAAPDLALDFIDTESISAYAQDALRWAVAADIIRGMGDGTLNPLGTATRAQVAAVLMRFVEFMEK